jgi:hypothetical protein
MLQPFSKKFAVCMMVPYSIAFPLNAFAQNLLDWQATGSGTMTSGSAFTMKNVTDKETLKYGSRRWGINLVWDKGTSLNNVTVEKAGGGPIAYGDPVAVKVNGGGYLKYGHRSVGVNLTWSGSPVYEWRIAGGDPGKPVSLSSPFALLNDVEHDALIYGSRPAGINLVWMKDYGKTTIDRAVGALSGAGKKLLAEYLNKYF